MGIKIEIDARPHEIEDIWLGDDGPFTFTSPKSAPVLSALRTLATATTEEEEIDDSLSVMDAQWQWLADGLGKETWDHLQDRLDDPKDPLDYPHLQALFDQLFQQQGGRRPPTSSGGSSGSRQARRAAAKQRPKAKTSG